MSFDNQTSTLLQHAYQVSPMSQFAIQQMQHYTKKIIADQNYVLKQNQILWSEKQNSIDIATFQTNALKRIDQDLYYLSTLNEAISNYTKPGEYDLTWSLATNKMTLILNGAKEFLSDTHHVHSLLNGRFPLCMSDYNNAPYGIVTCSDTSGSFGNSKITYLSAALLTVQLELLGEHSHLAGPWVDQSAITHITPIPDSIAHHLSASFAQNFSYYFSDNQTQHGLAFIHSGYAFGGHRDENRYGEQGKLYGPEDCSSWVSKLVGSDFSFSTIDMLYTFRMAQPESERGYVDPDWLNSDGAKTLNYLTPVFIQDPAKDIQPGLIWMVRVFQDDVDHQYSSGKSGHTALVIGLEEDKQVLTLGYGRNMPEVEGFGLQSFAAASEKNSEVMYFSITQPALSMQDILETNQDLFAETGPLQTATLLPEISSYQPIAILPSLEEQHVTL